MRWALVRSSTEEHNVARAVLRWLSAFILLAAGCGDARESAGLLGDLRAVGEEVRRATGHENVTVKLTNGRHLIIGMVNSRFGALADDGRREGARSIAEAAHRTFRSKGSLETVAVCFVVHRRYLLLISFTDATDCFAFKANELEESRKAE